MKILVLGADGYIGWPLSLRLSSLGYDVRGLDNFVRRQRVQDVGGNSVIPIADFRIRSNIVEIMTGNMKYLPSLQGYDVIVHLAEQPSAPFSMRDVGSCWETVNQNVLGTINLLWRMREQCPDAHLVKLGSMGEYGTPDCVIPEGIIPEECIAYYMDVGNYNKCVMKGLQFPKQPGSFYHLSKVFDSQAIEFACRAWGLRSTDTMQGIVFGTRTSDIDHADKATRFDYDQYFGTVINRFCVQAVLGIPLTVYGGGYQKRGFLPLKDSIECLTLAIQNPPDTGEYRVFNQFAMTQTVNQVAFSVGSVANKMGLKPHIENVGNPRVENEKNYYEPKHDRLKALGYEPKWSLSKEIQGVLEDLIPHKYHINRKVIYPTTTWK